MVKLFTLMVSDVVGSAAFGYKSQMLCLIVREERRFCRDVPAVEDLLQAVLPDQLK